MRRYYNIYGSTHRCRRVYVEYLKEVQDFVQLRNLDGYDFKKDKIKKIVRRQELDFYPFLMRGFFWYHYFSKIIRQRSIPFFLCLCFFSFWFFSSSQGLALNWQFIWFFSALLIRDSALWQHSSWWIWARHLFARPFSFVISFPSVFESLFLVFGITIGPLSPFLLAIVFFAPVLWLPTSHVSQYPPS